MERTHDAGLGTGRRPEDYHGNHTGAITAFPTLYEGVLASVQAYWEPILS